MRTTGWPWKWGTCWSLSLIHISAVQYLNTRYAAALSAREEDSPVQAKAAEVQEIIETYFIDDYDEDTLADGAASGMVDATGDEWSYYLSADEVAAYEESMANAYVGVGIKMCIRDSPEGVGQQNDLEEFHAIQKQIQTHRLHRAGLSLIHILHHGVFLHIKQEDPVGGKLDKFPQHADGHRKAEGRDGHIER